MPSWLSTDTAPAALLDELSKIGAAAEGESNKQRVLRALKTVGPAALGTGVGVGASELLMRHKGLNRFMRAKPPITTSKLRLVRWGLPIAGGLAAILGSKYRKKVDEGLSAKSPQ